jgi:hypothetical protein
MPKDQEKFFNFPSNDLRYFADGPSIPGLKPPPRLLSPVFALIDANVILSVIACKAQLIKPNARTNLEETVDAGALRLFATTQARDEVLRHLPTYKSKASLERMEAAKESVLEKIYVVEPQRRMSENIRKLRERDPDDVPHAELFEELGLDVILSKDNDWDATGYPRIGLDGDDLLLFLRDYARVTAEHRGLHGVAAVGVVATLAVGEALYKLFKRLPLGAELIAAGGALLAAGAAMVQGQASPDRQLPPDPMTDFLDRLRHSGELSAEMAARISKSVARREALTLDQHLLRVLAISNEPLALSEVEEQLRSTGHKWLAQDFRSELLRTLSANRNFAMSNDGKWQMRTPITIQETDLPAKIRDLHTSIDRKAQ